MSKRIRFAHADGAEEQRDDEDDDDEDAVAAASRRHKPLYTPVDIGPAWLLLSHGAFFAATISGIAGTIAFLIVAPVGLSLGVRLIAPGMSLFSVLIGAWTIYAIAGTWRQNAKLQDPVYGNGGFTALVLIMVFLIAIGVLTTVEAIVFVTT